MLHEQVLVDNIPRVSPDGSIGIQGVEEKNNKYNKNASMFENSVRAITLYAN